jgi:hypothetical protein
MVPRPLADQHRRRVPGAMADTVRIASRHSPQPVRNSAMSAPVGTRGPASIVTIGTTEVTGPGTSFARRPTSRPGQR